ncbi:MAG TPA: hypothetical protein DCL73_12855 [Treponema sp.]|nr:hypothetical protein [Treponema sp.]
MKKISIIVSAVCALVLPSCTTLQRDIALPAEQTEESGFSAEMESRLAAADAQALLGENAAGVKTSCLYIIGQAENKLAHMQPDKSVTARLTAIEGRAYLLIGDRERAESCFEKARKKNADDSAVVILAHRLGFLKKLDAAVSRHDESGVLILETAIDYYRNGNYADAAGSFDTAFLSLPPFYRHAYQMLRDTSWSMKDTVSDDAQFAKLLQLSEISVLQMVEIAQRSTNLLDIYTGGKKLAGRKLYAAVVKAGLLRSVSGRGEIGTSGSGQLSADTAVPRILCARFLWNLKNSGSGNEAAAVKYSRKYRGGLYAASPVPDVPLDSEDFDAVLGTVENELLVLPDGRNFNPYGMITGAEFNESVKKIK